MGAVIVKFTRPERGVGKLPQPDRRTAILDAAFPIFCSQSIADISLAKVARAAGVEVVDIETCIGDKSALEELVLRQLMTICDG